MHTAGTLEEAELIEPTDEPQPDSTAPTPTPETTALVSTAPDVIDGEVTAIIEPEPIQDHTPPKQKPYWLLLPFTIVCCLLFLAGSILLPLLSPSATIHIFPVEHTISTTTAMQVYGRPLPALTLSQSTTVPATGKMHQTATRATGEITFYNGLFTSQTIASGTILNGADGVKIVTDQLAIIPAANPPYIGQVTISAHALTTGASGNVAAYDINKECCVTAVKAVNTHAFTGGQNARDYIVVTKSDLASAETSIKTVLEKSERAALKAQVNQGEELLTLACKPSTTNDHQPGEEAKQVKVTVSETCSAVAYNAHDVYANDMQIITHEATKRLGTSYRMLGDMQVSIIHAAISDQTKGIVTIAVKLNATYVYQITPAERAQLTHLIAGKSKEQAEIDLLQVPGIQEASITSNVSTLPTDMGKITIVIA